MTAFCVSLIILILAFDRTARPVQRFGLFLAALVGLWVIQLTPADAATRCDPTVRYCKAAASWYGPGLYGNQVACPPYPRLTPGIVGVAHKTLRCGTLVTLRYRGRVRRARVIDRGPFVAGRDFDLTNGLRLSLGFPQPASRGHDTIEYRLPRTKL